MKNFKIKMRAKQWVCTSICIAMLGIVLLQSTVSALPQEVCAEKIAVVESPAEKMKESSNTSESLGALVKGDVIVILEETNRNDGWYLATMNDQNFFVAASQVKLVSNQEVFPHPIRARIKVDGVNLRSKPNVDAQIVCILKKGTLVDINQKTGNWYKISTGKTFGYVDCEYVDAISAEVSPIYLTLSMGMSGAEVKRLQEMLVNKGYSIDKINGTYGAKTRDAVKQFQKDNYMQSDGVAHIEMQVLLYQEEMIK